MGKRVAITTLIAIFVIPMLLVFLADAKNQAQSKNCASQITSICLGAAMWANDHAGLMPTNFLSMKDELNTPKILSCIPSRRAQDWASLTPQNCSYDIIAPGMSQSESNRPYLRCTIHGHLGFSDFTVFDGKRRRGKFD